MGLFQSNSGTFEGEHTPGRFEYTEISQSFTVANGWSSYYDEVAEASVLYHIDDGRVVSYESPRSMAAKARYVFEQGFSGAMVYESSFDVDGFPLLASFVQTLNQAIDASTTQTTTIPETNVGHTLRTHNQKQKHTHTHSFLIKLCIGLDRETRGWVFVERGSC